MEQNRKQIYESFTELLVAITEEGLCRFCEKEIHETEIEKHMMVHWNTRIKIEGTHDVC